MRTPQTAGRERDDGGMEPLAGVRRCARALLLCAWLSNAAEAETAGIAFLSRPTLVQQERVVVVNGESVTAREFIEALRRHRFRELDPAALREAAREEVVRFKVILQLAKMHGLLANTGAAALDRAFQEENQRRAQAAARGGPVFGPRRLTWPQFRAYWLDGIERELIRSLAEKRGPPTEEELSRFYREHPAIFTAPRAKAPEPFEEVRGHVADTYRKHHYVATVHAAIARAEVTPLTPILELLTPDLVLPDDPGDAPAP